MKTTLGELLAEDGINLRKAGKEWIGLCPFHKEGTPSFSVNLDEGLYHCFGCGEKGDAVTYLMSRRSMSKAEAVKMAGKVEGNPPLQWKPPKEAPHFSSHPPADAIAQYRYFFAGGDLAFIICRRPPREGETKKRFSALTPAKKNGAPGFLYHQALEKDRPLYRLPELVAAPKDKQVMVVEGEKVADAVAKNFPKALVTTWPHGTQSWRLADWGPLAGRPLLLVADADAPGRKAMGEIAAHIHKDAGPIRIILPPGESGEDLVEELAHGGATKVIGWLQSNADNYRPPKEEHPKSHEEEEPKEPPQPAPNEVLDSRFFQVLGNVGDLVAIKLSTHRIMYYGRTQMCHSSTLISLADFHWWLAVLGCSSMSTSACQRVGSALIRQADIKGQVDMRRVIGRGCFWDRKSLVWHLGDRLHSGGKDIALAEYDGEGIPLAGPRIRLHGAVATMEERHAYAAALMRCAWDTPEDCQRIMGWIVASIIGGGLEWRPHAWIAAPPDSGKSWLLEHLVQGVLGDFCAAKTADPSVAGLAREMQSDSLPVLIDEREPNRPALGAMLEYVRIAAGGDGSRIRAAGNDAVQSFSPRFSALLSSVAMPNLEAADESRFCLVALDKNKQDQREWPEIRKQIMDCHVPGFKEAVIRDAGGMIVLIKQLADKLVVEGMGTRRAMIQAALSVGWKWWSGEEKAVPIRSGQSETEKDNLDAGELLRDILGLRLRDKLGGDKSIAAILQDGDRDALCRDYGIMLDSGELLVAVNHPSLRSKMDKTRWRNTQLRSALLQINGVSQTPHGRRFGGLRQRAIQVPMAVCDRLGISLWETGEINWDKRGDDEAKENRLY